MTAEVREKKDCELGTQEQAKGLGCLEKVQAGTHRGTQVAMVARIQHRGGKSLWQKGHGNKGGKGTEKCGKATAGLGLAATQDTL